MHFLDALWAYRNLPKSATGFSPFSLVYWTESMSLLDRINEPGRSDDSVFKSYVDAREGKRERGFSGRKV